MTVPTPPLEPNPWAPPSEGPKAPDAPGAPGQPEAGDGPPQQPQAPGQGPGYDGYGGYGYPTAGYGPGPGHGYPQSPQQAAPRNGMGITALVLGLVGVFLGMLILLFWLSWIPALLAVIFGFVGLGHVKKGTANNRGVALSGMILGMVGILLATGTGIFAVTSIQDRVHDSILEIEGQDDAARAPERRGGSAADKELDRLDKKRAAAEASESAAAAAEAEAAKPKAFGTTFTYPNGVSIRIDKPVPYTASSTASGHTAGYRTYTVKITMVNGSKKKFDSLYAIPRFKDADDAEVRTVFDGDVPTSFRGALHPGKAKTGTYAFDLPPEAAGSTQVEMSPGIGYDEAIWSGPTE
jgi:hypothetical protein